MTPVATEHPDMARLRAARPSRVADAISRFLDPAVLVPVGAFLVVQRTAPDTQRLLIWLSTIVFCYLVVPSAAVVVLTRSGRIEDRHIVRREQRVIPMAVAAISGLVGTVLLLSWRVPPLVAAYVLAPMANLLVLGPITTRFKVSIHTAVAAGFGVTITWLFHCPGAMAGTLIVALVAWARIRAGRHRVTEVLVGGVLAGCLTALVMWAVLRGW